MCVMVIVGVVNCRLDCKQFLLYYFLAPNLATHGFVCAEWSSIFVIRLWRINLNCVIFSKHYTTVIFDVYFIMIAYLKTVTCI